MLYLRSLLLLVFAVTLLQSSAHAQTAALTLTGTVTDAATGEPLVGANVFIAVSMIGTTTDRNGQYRLERVPPGAHRLYVSILGFEPGIRDVLLREDGATVFDFEMTATVLELEGVVVEGKRDRRWRRRYERFVKLFIGETPNSQQTTIMNPEVLDFSDKVGRLTAYASEPLIIENKALGYRLTYFLKDFAAEAGRTQYDGEPLFEEMEPEDDFQAQQWEQARRAAFIGSFRHFALALLAGQVKEQGFETFSRPSVQQMAGAGGAQNMMQGNQRFPLEPTELYSPGERPNEKILDFQGFVEIVYKGELEDESYLAWSRGGRLGGKPKFQTSWINLERGPTVLDYKGDILDPYGVTFYGYLAFERIGDELPKEYRPGR